MKYLGLLLILAFSLSPSYADVLKDESDVTALAESIMQDVATGNLGEGLAKLKPYVSIPTEQIDALIIQSVSSRKQVADQIGNTFGYELLGKKEVGSSLLRLVYAEKTTKIAITWTFVFYKNNEGWVIPGFKFDMDHEVPFYHEHD